MLRSPRLRPSWLISYARNTVVEINRNVMTQVLDSKTNQVVRSDWGLSRWGSVKRGLVADPGGYDSWGEQRPHRLGLLSAERAPPAADLRGLSQAVSWRGEARTGREEGGEKAQSLEVNMVVNSDNREEVFFYPVKPAKIAGLVL